MTDARCTEAVVMPPKKTTTTTMSAAKTTGSGAGKGAAGAATTAGKAGTPGGGVRGYWSQPEEQALKRAVRKHGIGAWEKMRNDPEFTALRCVWTVSREGKRGEERDAGRGTARVARERERDTDERVTDGETTRA